ncbi:ParB-like protein [Sphingomonas sp.]|uniref:ParB-like protein n=1 Tax=Sphingomonas sp. TaxID=28214 RepID=UPI001DF4BA0C|nr:ParB-like protein [Sphingomonas sp.]MBX9796628.1 chromosome partitioning protein ParB [Sphingomonas sp.]
MHNDPEPQLHPVPLSALRPTQMTVGMIEVARKRHDWRARMAESGGDFLGSHMIPVVIGPKRVPWLIDHHHLALALLEEGVPHVLTSVVARLDHLEPAQFLTFMDNRNWLHMFDAKGVRRGYADLPKKLTKLADDPYRSLAGAVRRAGGYAKSATPYSEFLWADFLRHRVPARLIATDMTKATGKALKLAHGESASHLPGWCGPS